MTQAGLDFIESLSIKVDVSIFLGNTFSLLFITIDDFSMAHSPRIGGLLIED